MSYEEASQPIKELQAIIRNMENRPVGSGQAGFSKAFDVKQLYDWIDNNVIEVGVQRFDSNLELSRLREFGGNPSHEDHRKRALVAKLAEQLLKVMPCETNEIMGGNVTSYRAFVLLSDAKEIRNDRD